MWILCSDTNASVGGIAVPYGQCEFPLHGSVGIVTSGGVNTNLVVGSGDTLSIWRDGAAVVPGVEPWQMFLLGVWVVVGVFGLLAFARRIARFLSGNRVKEI